MRTCNCGEFICELAQGTRSSFEWWKVHGRFRKRERFRFHSLTGWLFLTWKFGEWNWWAREYFAFFAPMTGYIIKFCRHLNSARYTMEQSLRKQLRTPNNYYPASYRPDTIHFWRAKKRYSQAIKLSGRNLTKTMKAVAAHLWDRTRALSIRPLKARCSGMHFG